MKYTNSLKKLSARIGGYEKFIKEGRHEMKVGQRLETGGYKRPGLQNRHKN